MGVGGQHHAPAALSPEKDRYPLYRRLGEPEGRSGRVWRKEYPVPTRASKPRTVQPVARRYTDYERSHVHSLVLASKTRAFVNMPLNFRERNPAKSLFSSLLCVMHRTKELRFTPLWLIPRHKKSFSHHYVTLVRLCAESGRKTLPVICSQVHTISPCTPNTYTKQTPSSLSLRATTHSSFVASYASA